MTDETNIRDSVKDAVAAIGEKHSKKEYETEVIGDLTILKEKPNKKKKKKSKNKKEDKENEHINTIQETILSGESKDKNEIGSEKEIDKAETKEEINQSEAQGETKEEINKNENQSEVKEEVIRKAKLSDLARFRGK